jgi:dihydrodipicolinate synthase/N-acetylneuraminate lyase
MDYQKSRDRLCGCYVTVPTQFHDEDLALNMSAMRQHVRFLLEGGIRASTGVLLAGGAAGDFSTMTTQERLDVAAVVIEEAAGKVPVTVGAQTTSTMEIVELARGAQRLGADYIQVSAPFYFNHTHEDFHEFVSAAALAAPEVGIIIYQTTFAGTEISREMVARLVEIPNVVGLKWSAHNDFAMSFERVIIDYADRLSVIDNQNRFIASHILGGRGIETHICNHWPEWGVKMWRLLEERRYEEAHKEHVRVVLPFMELWAEMANFTGGDGYLDKLCMELVGLNSSRSRPPTRDLRAQFRSKAYEMLSACGTPRLVEQPETS